MTLSRRSFLAQSAALTTLLATAKQSALANALAMTGLKDAFKEDFYIGTAIGAAKMDNDDPVYWNLLKQEFNAITMENDMKWERIRPTLNEWDWDRADRFVKYGLETNQYIVGHVLVWHSQVPPEVFLNKKGDKLNRKWLLKRMEDHIQTVVGRYKGKIDAWDVVNEAVDEDKGWRKSPWFEAIGPDFVEHAFRFAAEADPDAHLLYNDYNMHNPGKRDFVVNFVKRYKRKGVPIHGIGMQGHVGLDFPNIKEFEKSIEAYAAAGTKVHITELDMDVLPVAWDHIGAEISTEFEYSDELNPYPNGLPKKIEKQLTDRYVEYFKLFLKHRDKIERVTFWGTGDIESWKNDFPVKGRTNYPLIFDREYKAKDAYHAIMALKN